MKLLKTILFISCMLFTAPCFAYNLDSQQEAINIIKKTAKDFCDTVPLSGGTEGVQLTGDAKVKVSGLVKKLADMGIKGAFKYEKNEYEGVLQKDLAEILNKSANCKMDIWNDLHEKLILPVEKSEIEQVSTKNREALIKDQHPTELSIKSIKFRKYLGVEEPYVVAVVENSSTVSAKNVTASFWKGNDAEIKSDDSIYKQYHYKNLLIRSGKKHDFPIAPLSKYVNAISAKSKPEELVDFTLPNQPKLPLALQEKVCGDTNKGGCSFNSFTRGTFVVLKYDTIFGDRVTKTTGFSNVFLSGKVMRY